MSAMEESVIDPQATIRLLHAELDQTNREVMALTLELEQRVESLQAEIAERQKAEAERQAQMERLNLLNQITRAIAERQDLPSILQVAIRSLEDRLSLDFACACLREASEDFLTVASIGVRSHDLVDQIAAPSPARIGTQELHLARCLRGEVVYEPDIQHGQLPFTRQLASSGLRALIAIPLISEQTVFGALLVARRQMDGFTNDDREFVRQLSEHVALAGHQARLYGALQGAYEELRRTQQAITQQERLRALGQMASGIAHDINNAITPISLYTDLLLANEPGLSARGRGCLETISRAIGDVANTVARMREFYRPREAEVVLQPVDLNEMVKQVLDLTRARWFDMPQKRGVLIEVQTRLAANLPNVPGLASEIREALTNLIFNAVDAMPSGGTLTLRTLSSGTQVRCEVSDTGVGMDEDTRRRCLEPFFTTKGERGTGLGLAMVYGVAQRHQAKVEIDSAPGQGTTMALVFQLSAAMAEPRPVVASPEEPAPQTALRILVVDDDPVLLKSLREVLEAEGHCVTTANGGQEGIDAFKSGGGAEGGFSVVITDLGMPRVDGRQVATAVKVTSAATPVIMLTGWGRRLAADGEKPANVDCMLSKPPQLRELRAVLRAVTQAR
jgi:signal transduction histidine kinase/ActR/RegA family two-component response regulator